MPIPIWNRCYNRSSKTAAGARKSMDAVSYSLHSFRHTFVSFCANAGVPLDIVATIVGHGSSAMTRHYAHISDEAKKQAIATLPVLSQPIGETPARQQLLELLQGLFDASRSIRKIFESFDFISFKTNFLQILKFISK